MLCWTGLSETFTDTKKFDQNRYTVNGKITFFSKSEMRKNTVFTKTVTHPVIEPQQQDFTALSFTPNHKSDTQRSCYDWARPDPPHISAGCSSTLWNNAPPRRFCNCCKKKRESSPSWFTSITLAWFPLPLTVCSLCIMSMSCTVPFTVNTNVTKLLDAVVRMLISFITSVKTPQSLIIICN